MPWMITWDDNLRRFEMVPDSLTDVLCWADKDNDSVALPAALTGASEDEHLYRWY